LNFGSFIYLWATRWNFGANLTIRRNFSCRSWLRLTRKCASKLAIFWDRRIDAFGDITKSNWLTAFFEKKIWILYSSGDFYLLKKSS
jgi:hypothetical protein